MRIVAAFFCLALSLCSSLYGDAKEHRIAVPSHGVLKLQLTESWKLLPIEKTSRIPLTIHIKPREGDLFDVKISPLWRSKQGAAKVADKDVKGFAEDLLARAQTQAVGSPKLQPLQGVLYSGYSYFLTDKAPVPGEYPYMIQAFLGVDELIVYATILLRTKNEEEIESCLKILKTIVHVGEERISGGIADENVKKNAFKVPGTDIELSFLGPELPDRNHGASKNGKNHQFQAKGAGMMMTLFIEPPARKGGHKECADHYWGMGRKNPMIDQATIKRVDVPGYSKVEYMIVAELLGKKHAFLHANYFVSYGGKWIDLHVSFPGADEVYGRSVLARIDESLAVSQGKE